MIKTYAQKKAVIYARVSSKEQKQEGYSIPAQIRLLRDYAAKNNFDVCATFSDQETARKNGRPEYEKMLIFLKNENSNKSAPCRIILVEKTDRLYRNLPDYSRLEDLDVEIHLVKEGEILSKDSCASVWCICSASASSGFLSRAQIPRL